MPPLYCPVLILRPVPPQCRFAWQGLPFMPFGYRSPVGLSGPVIIFVTCGHMRRFGYSLPWGIMPGYNLFNCHPKCHLPPGRIYNRFFHIHKNCFQCNVLYKFLRMAGGFPKVPALRAACFARCCTAPLRSLIYHCVYLLSLLSLSLCLPRRSQPCCRGLQFYAGPKPALVVRLASLRVSRICTICDLLCSTSMA